jgi:hypothetical protein
MANSSDLVRDLNKVPEIIGALGLSIAAAQKAFDLNYLENLQQILQLTKVILGKKKAKAGGAGAAGATSEDLKDKDLENFEAFKGVLKEMLTALAPSHYQFSETTFTVRLDLSQTMDIGGTVGLGLGYGGVAINAAFTIGYGFDYRAAAECHTVIHAIPADRSVFSALLERAEKINDKALEPLKPSDADKAISDRSSEIFEKLIGVKPPLPQQGT